MARKPGKKQMENRVGYTGEYKRRKRVHKRRVKRRRNRLRVEFGGEVRVVRLAIRKNYLKNSLVYRLVIVILVDCNMLGLQ